MPVDEEDNYYSGSDGEEHEVAKGFDRDVDYEDIKQRLIAKYEELALGLDVLDIEAKNYVIQKRFMIHKVIYCIIAMIQLRSGSRIIEACRAAKIFIKKDKYQSKVNVKIAKSESLKKKSNGDEFTTEARYRKMAFPHKWFTLTPNILEFVKFHIKMIPSKNLKQRVLDFLLKEFKCNTHSLRYAFINYMLIDKKKEITVVAKFIGHVNVNQLVRYTQQKKVDEMFDDDI